jgi:hypothetical protein
MNRLVAAFPQVERLFDRLTLYREGELAVAGHDVVDI